MYLQKRGRSGTNYWAESSGVEQSKWQGRDPIGCDFLARVIRAVMMSAGQPG